LHQVGISLYFIALKHFPETDSVVIRSLPPGAYPIAVNKYYYNNNLKWAILGT